MLNRSRAAGPTQEVIVKSILLLVHDDDGQEARLQAALDVVRAVDGHLSCLDVAILPLLGAGYAGAGAEAMLLCDEYARESANKIRLAERLAKEGVAWDWQDVCGPLAPSLADAASLADLIIVNRRLDSFPVPDMPAVVADLLAAAHKPILAVPEASRGINLSERVLIAWDGSPSAATATRAAIPLLKLAGEVTLLEIDDGSIEIPAEEVAAYLSREDIHVALRREKADKHLVAERLCVESRNGSFSYVVMGGFGHSQLREAIFGGVTRRMLRESAVPLFLAR